MGAFVVAVVGDEEAGGDGRRGESVLRVEGFEDLSGLRWEVRYGRIVGILHALLTRVQRTCPSPIRRNNEPRKNDLGNMAYFMVGFDVEEERGDHADCFLSTDIALFEGFSAQVR